jgi:hypothetical protein
MAPASAAGNYPTPADLSNFTAFPVFAAAVVVGVWDKMQDFSATAARTPAEEGTTFPIAGLGARAASKRITAESFRLLTRRLKHEAVIPEIAADVQSASPASFSIAELPQVAVVIPPAAEPEFESLPPALGLAGQQATPEPALLPVDSLELPRFIPLENAFSLALEQETEPESLESSIGEELPDPSLQALASEADLPLAFAAVEDLDTDFDPDVDVETGQEILVSELASLAAEDAAPEFPSIDASEELSVAAEQAVVTAEAEPVAAEAETTADIQFEAPPLEAFEPEPAVQVEPELAVEVEASPVSTDTAGTGPRTAKPLADKVVEALVKTVAEAVYAKPTAAERAAFLREVAELVERGEAEPVAYPHLADAAATALAPLPAPLPAGEPAPEPAPEPIGTAIAEKLGPDSPLLRKTEGSDPFASPLASRFMLARPTETPEADEDTGELALSLLDMMSGGAAASQPQERALAADTLLRLVPRIPARQLLTIAERVAIMEQPPSLLVARLIRDPRPEIAAPLLERCMHISDHDLMLAATEGDAQKQRMTARRRIISPTLSDQLIARGDTSVILTLVRNPGASFNHDAFYRLADHAIQHHSVLAPLATRADLPAPVAFELFWHVPQELRRFIFSRFLTDSENLNRILKITLATQSGGDGALLSAESRFPPREAVDEAIDLFVTGSLDSGAQKLGEIASVVPETVIRALTDRDGEPLAVIMKALGYPRGKFAEVLEKLQNAEVQLVDPSRKSEDLQRIFETLSFNKARILLTYWDWFIRKSGPYAPHN